MPDRTMAGHTISDRGPVPTAILISGRGSNMEALARAAREPGYPAAIRLVLSNVAGAGGLAVAAGMGIPTATVPHRDYPDRAAFESAVQEALFRHGIGLVALAGFMRILTPAFVGQWEGRILNVHPSLLPLYPGLHTHARAIAAGDREAGCTVHMVTAALDSGPVIRQARVPIRPGDTPDTLAARVLVEEHRIYPEALEEVARRLQQG